MEICDKKKDRGVYTEYISGNLYTRKGEETIYMYSSTCGALINLKTGHSFKGFPSGAAYRKDSIILDVTSLYCLTKKDTV